MGEMLSLPNLHPALVHFPIALLPAALLLEVLGWLRKGEDWAERAAVALYALAAVAATAAYLAGRRAEDSLVGVDAIAHAALARHADAALVALGLTLLLAVGRCALALRDRRRGRGTGALTVTVGVLGGAAAVLAIGVTADRGGALVYRHGLAVARSPALAAVPVPAVRAAPAAAEPGAESFVVEGVVWFRLKDQADDATFAAELELTSFRGTVELVHHLTDDANASVFSVDPSGAARLLVRKNGAEEVLAEGPSGGLSGRTRLEVSVAGRHLKGLIDGRTVVHGHGESGAGRGLALRFEGRGTVVVLRTEVRKSKESV